MQCEGSIGDRQAVRSVSGRVMQARRASCEMTSNAGGRGGSGGAEQEWKIRLRANDWSVSEWGFEPQSSKSNTLATTPH